MEGQREAHKDRTAAALIPQTGQEYRDHCGEAGAGPLHARMPTKHSERAERCLTTALLVMDGREGKASKVPSNVNEVDVPILAFYVYIR